MNVGFFTVIRRDPQHALHAVALIESIQEHMPHAEIWHFTDELTPRLALGVKMATLPDGPMLERRIEHYSNAGQGEDWLFLDTDTKVLADVSDLFKNASWDIAVADRNWPGIPQGDDAMHTMPFNTGVVFSRRQAFWQEMLAVWRAYPREQKDWMSEQRAFYEVVRTGKYRVKILPGQVYNYPPRTKDDDCAGAKISHFKGPRKAWLTEQIRASWQTVDV